MQNFGTIIHNFDAVTKQYVDDKASAKRIRGIKVDNATLADTAKKVQNAFTYKAHNKAAGTVLPITYDGSRAASLDFSANDFAYDYNSFNDIKIKLVDKDYATTSQVNAKYTKPESGIPKSDLATSVQTSLDKADSALQSAPVTSVNGKTGAVQLGASDVGALPTSTKYVVSVNGESGEVKNIAKTNSANTFTGDQTVTGNGSVSGNFTVGGNLTVNGTTTTVDSTTLQVKDKLIEVAHGNTKKLTSPAGIVAPKYDGTNSGALVFNGDGIASVGDVVLDASGNINVTQSNLQPLATRTGLVNDNLVKYDGTNQTLVDTGKKISDFATVAQVNAKYTKPESGIPKSDLAVSVQTSLDKADTALQSAPVASVNGKTGVVTLGAEDVGALPSSTKFVSSVNGETGAVTGIATKDELNAKQNALTETQLAAVNSGITEAKRTKYDGYEEIINQKANSADLATVATSGSYNDLSNIPVINQDLTTSGFTPVANSYYRHTGTTTDTFTQGVIYLYNGTGYAALDGSGSGGGKSYELVVARVALTNDGSGAAKRYTVPADVYSPSVNFAMWLYERAIPGRWRLIITDLDTRDAIALTPCYPLYDKHWYGGINDTGASSHPMVFSSETSYDIKTDYYTTTRLYEVDVKQNTISFYNNRLVKETYMFNKDVLTRKADTPFNKSGNISVILEYTILSEVTE